jgi:hypothetical protein
MTRRKPTKNPDGLPHAKEDAPEYRRGAFNTSIALDNALLAIVDARTGSNGGRSVVIRALISGYAEIVRRERPELDAAEWNAIRDALNGMWLLAEQSGIGMLASGLPHELADACRLEGLAEKWTIDGPALVRKVEALGFAARVAVLDDVLRFWARMDVESREAFGETAREEEAKND